jgi:O-antigen/teichoic acid export membrane protein
MLARQAGLAFFWKGFQLAGNKLIFLARTIILARILVPEDFGLMAITLVAVGFLTGITDLGMIPALVQSSQVDERTYDVAWTIGMVRAIAITLIVFLAAPWIAAAFAEPRATELIRVAAIRPVLDAASSIKVAKITRELRFRSLTVLKFTEALVSTVISIALAPSFGVWALIIGTLTGLFSYLILSYLLAPHRPRLLFDREAFKSLVNFGQWIFLTSVIVVVGGSLLQLVISRSLGVAELGLYFLATKLAFIPYEVSSEVIGSVAFPLYSRLQSDLKQAARVFRSVLFGMWALIVPTCLLLIALTPSIVEEILGPKWEGTAPLIRLLAIVNVISLLADSITPILKGVGQPQRVTAIEAFQYTLLVALIWSLTSQFGVTGAALAWLIAGGFTQVIGLWFLNQIIPQPLSGLFKPFGLIALTSAIGAILALGIASYLPGLPGLIVASIASSVVIALLFWFVDQAFHLNLSKDFSKAFPQLAAFMRISLSDS